MSQKGDVKADAKADSTVDARASRPLDTRETKFPAAQDAAKKAEAEKDKAPIRTSAKFPSLTLGKPSPPPAKPSAPVDDEDDDEYEDDELEDELDDEEGDPDAKPGLLSRLLPTGGKNRRAWEFGAGIGALVVLVGTLTMLLWGRLSAKGPPPPTNAVAGTGALAPSVKPSAGIGGKHDKVQPSTAEGVAARRGKATGDAPPTSAVRTAAYDEPQPPLPSQTGATAKTNPPAPAQFTGSSPIVDAAVNGQAQGGPIPLANDPAFADPNAAVSGLGQPTDDLPVAPATPFGAPGLAGAPDVGFAPPTEVAPPGGFSGATAMPATNPYDTAGAASPLGTSALDPNTAPVGSPFGAPTGNAAFANDAPPAVDPLAMPGAPAAQADPFAADQGGYSATAAPAGDAAGSTFNVVGGQPAAVPAATGGGFAAPDDVGDLGFGAPAGAAMDPPAADPAANPLPFGGVDAAAGGASADPLPFDNNPGANPAAASPFGGQPETPTTGPAGAVDEPPFGANTAFPAGSADLNAAPPAVDPLGGAPAADPFGAGGMAAQPAATGGLNPGGYSATDLNAPAAPAATLGGFDNDRQFGAGQETTGGAPATGFADPSTEAAMPAATDPPAESRPYGRPANSASNTIDGAPAGDGWSPRGDSAYGNNNNPNFEASDLSGGVPATNAASNLGNTFDTSTPADAGYSAEPAAPAAGGLQFDGNQDVGVGSAPAMDQAPPPAVPAETERFAPPPAAYDATPAYDPPAATATPPAYDPPAASAMPAAEPAARPATGDGVESYTIAEYDTYWSIAEKVYGDGSYYKALQAYNGDHSLLRVGQPLAVPRVDVLERRHPELCPSRLAVAVPAAAPTVRVPAAASGAGRKYQVQAGDTLYEIARAELGKGARWVEIYEINREKIGENADSLPPGLELALPSQPSASDAPRVGSQPRIRLR